MAPPKTKTRPRSSGSGSARTGSKTTLRRPPPKRGAGISNFVLPLSVLGIFVVIAVALIVLYRVSSNTGGAPSGDTVANVRCDAGEQLATHYHTHLTILYQGTFAEGRGLEEVLREWAGVDGTRVALSSSDQEGDLWIWDLRRPTLTRLTFDPGLDWFPVWTTDGRRIIFSSNRSSAFNLWWQAADGTGTAERLTTSSQPQFPSGITPDGTALVFAEGTPAMGSRK